ncbi:ABC transporter ATP-binding protein [Massilibacterium senegalense]|uniref:ABC transporter ATP-binding protein n=1 Tax=Massilibacterium senegalense TaxID=1632858 RepID=UPI00078247B5|nr:ABC transporter ATP-binding protein [Massilibacterium senegalense]
MLKIKYLTKTYKQGDGIFDINIEVPAGTILGILGANGAGKTTLLRCIAGLLQPQSGDIRICNEIPGSEKAKSLTAYVPDQAYLFPTLTVAEHLQFKAKAFGIPRKSLESSVYDALKAVQMTELSDRTSGNLSKGQKQRAMLASAYIQKAELYIFDEPTNGLDIPSRQWLAEWLMAQKYKNKIIIVSSHSLDFIQEIADQCLLLEKGKMKNFKEVPKENKEITQWSNNIIKELGGVVRLYD